MRINRTTDFELLARLNKPVHELHVSLYPEHFTEYNFEAIRDLFKQWITKENFVFFLMERAAARLRMDRIKKLPSKRLVKRT
ncbi:hypothetical protein ACHHV8_20535 [Paenibacillus sp. TAB 01]|uniref:hypothetical protein n=1 Tax=Paenibacillus sp. TAB 01 TaxID=3368988 RepID=UPI003751D0C4